jgi:hypothetical protein
VSHGTFLIKIQKQRRGISPHVDCHLFLMNKIVYCQSDRKFQWTRRNQKMFHPVEHQRWGGASEEEIGKLIEKKTPKKCCIEYPVTAIIYCQTDKLFKILDFLFKKLFSVSVHYILSPNITRFMINKP